LARAFKTAKDEFVGDGGRMGMSLALSCSNVSGTDGVKQQFAWQKFQHWKEMFPN
jgi:hypothetical protein